MFNITKNILLNQYSNYKIGGPAKLFVEVSSIEELKEILRSAQDDIFILGGGTNLLISDGGFNGLVIHNKIRGIKLENSTLTVGSGVLFSELLNFCIDNSLSGLEWAGGLPGTVGGAVRGNAGAFKGETKDSVAQVKSLNLKTASNAADALNEKIRSNAECLFKYRDSIFKSGEGKDEFITSVVFNLKPGSREEIRKAIQEKIDYRNLKHPMDYPNIGSTFKNIPFDSLAENLKKEFAPIVKTDPFPVVPTTKLLALAGLKGRGVGGAMISEKHPNFIVNIDNAIAEDVKSLIKIAKDTIKQKYEISLEEEIIYLN